MQLYRVCNTKNDIKEIVTTAEEAYEEYEPRKLNQTWLHLQMVMTELLKVNGENNYKTPHIGKNKLENRGLLPRSFTVEDELISQATTFLEDEYIFQASARGGTRTSIYQNRVENSSQVVALTSEH